MVGVVFSSAALLVGIAIVVLGTRSRLRAGPTEGFQRFNLALLIGVGLIAGSIVGFTHAH